MVFKPPNRDELNVLTRKNPRLTRKLEKLFREAGEVTPGAITNIYTLAGVTEGATDFGTFPGDILSDNADAKTLLAELEAAIEALDKYDPLTHAQAKELDESFFYDSWLENDGVGYKAQRYELATSTVTTLTPASGSQPTNLAAFQAEPW